MRFPTSVPVPPALSRLDPDSLCNVFGFAMGSVHEFDTALGIRRSIETEKTVFSWIKRQFKELGIGKPKDVDDARDLLAAFFNNYTPLRKQNNLPSPDPPSLDKVGLRWVGPWEDITRGIKAKPFDAKYLQKVIDVYPYDFDFGEEGTYFNDDFYLTALESNNLEAFDILLKSGSPKDREDLLRSAIAWHEKAPLALKYIWKRFPVSQAKLKELLTTTPRHL